MSAVTLLCGFGFGLCLRVLLRLWRHQGQLEAQSREWEKALAALETRRAELIERGGSHD